MRTMTIEKTVYQFEELNDKAKDKAREWYRTGDDFDPNFEPFETAAKILGIELTNNSLTSGIRYTGFYSQGDGASFIGSYQFAKGCAKAIRAEFGTDEKLHSIADKLNLLYIRYRMMYGTELTAKITTSNSRYSHENTMQIEVDTLDGSPVRDVDDVDELSELMRDFARWIYRSLQSQYEYEQENEYVDDCIMANEYEFTEDGSIAA